jgi:hypothetical protein
MLIALALLIAFSWILTRHAGLALVTALSPLPGFVLAALTIRHSPSIFCYLPGYIVAGVLTGTVAPLAANAPARDAVQQSLQDLWPVLLAELLIFVPAIFSDRAALYCMAGEISAIALAALGLLLLSYDEGSVARINRAVEARIREIERLDFLTQPRWSMSIGGIALVFSVLGFFGTHRGIAIDSSHAVIFGSAAGMFLLVTLATARNVRRAVAAVLALAPVILLIIALSDRFVYSASILLPPVVAAMPVLFMTAGARGFERAGDKWDVATQRGITRFGPCVATAVIASSVAAFLSGSLSRGGVVEGVALLLGEIAALILQPALTTMLYVLFPKRVSLEEAFRKR